MKRFALRAAATLAALAASVALVAVPASASTGPAFICHPQPQCRF